MEVSIKILRKLLNKKYRRDFSLCILQGEKIIADNCDKIVKIFSQNELPKELLKEIVGLENYGGSIAVAKIPEPTAPTTPFLVLDNIQDANNVGALLRSAAAFDYKTVYCIDCADQYSPKVIRTSSGMSLQLNIVACDYADLPSNCALYIADADGKPLQDIKPADCNFGVVLGNEGCGVSPGLYRRPHTAASIPMQPACESLNVAVAGGIIMYCLNNK
jgi:TrmH family RNA methyltransferase